MITKKTKLLFVYNAKSTLIAQVTDFVHKIVASETYQCNLCRITYGNLGMKHQWQSFIKSLPMPTQFLHKDELHRAYPDLSSMELPAVIMVDDSEPRILISASEINKAHDIDSLIKLINNKLTQERM